MTDPHPSRSRWFWVGLAVGGALIAIGVRGLLHDHNATQPSDLFKWFIGAGVVHDAVIAPAVIAAGWATARVVPAPARVPVRLGLAASALLTLVTWPLVQGWGRRAANPSALPLDYGRNLIAAVAVLWCAVLVSSIVRVRRARP